MIDGEQQILHVCERELIGDLRTKLLRHQGFQVTPAASFDEAYQLYERQAYKLLLIDVEGNPHVPAAEEFCRQVKKTRPDQKVAFICNYRVSMHPDCPDEIIQSDFNPAALVEGVSQLLP